MEEYPNVWGCFTKLRANKKLWLVLRCEKSIGYGLDNKINSSSIPNKVNA